jgi:hypothetical protein
VTWRRWPAAAAARATTVNAGYALRCAALHCSRGRARRRDRHQTCPSPVGDDQGKHRHRPSARRTQTLRPSASLVRSLTARRKHKAGSRRARRRLQRAHLRTATFAAQQRCPAVLGRRNFSICRIGCMPCHAHPTPPCPRVSRLPTTICIAAFFDAVRRRQQKAARRCRHDHVCTPLSRSTQHRKILPPWCGAPIERGRTCPMTLRIVEAGLLHAASVAHAIGSQDIAQQ